MSAAPRVAPPGARRVRHPLRPPGRRRLLGARLGCGDDRPAGRVGVRRRPGRPAPRSRRHRRDPGRGRGARLPARAVALRGAPGRPRRRAARADALAGLALRPPHPAGAGRARRMAQRGPAGAGHRRRRRPAGPLPAHAAARDDRRRCGRDRHRRRRLHPPLGRVGARGVVGRGDRGVGAAQLAAPRRQRPGRHVRCAQRPGGRRAGGSPRVARVRGGRCRAGGSRGPGRTRRHARTPPRPRGRHLGVVDSAVRGRRRDGGAGVGGRGGARPSDRPGHGGGAAAGGVGHIRDGADRAPGHGSRPERARLGRPPLRAR